MRRPRRAAISIACGSSRGSREASASSAPARISRPSARNSPRNIRISIRTHRRGPDARRHRGADPAGIADPAGRSRIRSADRVRQRRQPAAGSRRRPAARNRHPQFVGRGAVPDLPAGAHREPVLACAGGAAGLRSRPRFHGLLALAPPNVPRLAEVALDWQVVALRWWFRWSPESCSAWRPRWYASRTGREFDAQGSRPSSGRSRVRTCWWPARSRCALILLAGAGLLMRSFYEIVHVDAASIRSTSSPCSSLRRREILGHDDLQIQLARNILDQSRRSPESARGHRLGPAAARQSDLHHAIRRWPAGHAEPGAAGEFFRRSRPAFWTRMGMRILRGRGSRIGYRAPRWSRW